MDSVSYYIELSNFNIKTNNYKFSLDFAQKAIDYANAKKDVKSEAYANTMLGGIYFELKKYDAPVEKFAPGKELYEIGDQAIRKTLIPTIALLFSLLGAVSHAAKFAMIIITAILERFVRPRTHYALAVWLGLVAASGAILLHVDNRVTGSELYANMERQAVKGADGVIGGNVSIGVLHVINVGQGYGYPVFEFIRTHVLGGINYGFDAPEVSR